MRVNLRSIIAKSWSGAGRVTIPCMVCLLFAACSAGAETQPREVPPLKPSLPQATAPDSGSLSENLSRSQGVIEPKPIDPEMVQPPPETGAKMPVIPPPGTPGGNPDVHPK